MIFLAPDLDRLTPQSISPPPVLGRVGDFDIDRFTIIELDGVRVPIGDVPRTGVKVTSVDVTSKFGKVRRITFETVKD